MRTSDARWTAVDAYVVDNLLPPDEALESALNASAAAGLPAINVSPPLGKLLFLLALGCGARRILEIGTLGGYSSIWLARALPSDGRLITLELQPEHVRVAAANIAGAGLSERVDIRLGPALKTLEDMTAAGEGPFDLIFIDADKPGYPEYFKWAMRLARSGTLIVADNVVRDGALANLESADANVRAVQHYTRMLAAERRVTATIVQTVGSKGYDGFALAVVTDGHDG